jgi:two-component system OmpR family response regulator
LSCRNRRGRVHLLKLAHGQGAPAGAGNDAMPRVLLIEDHDETANEIVAELAGRGFDVDRAATGAEGLDKARAGKADVMVVDRVLPGIDGLTIIEVARRERVQTPALVLSALAAVDDRVRGLEAGGDDYLAKPFAVSELVARIQALLRRPVDKGETVLRLGRLELDLLGRTAKRDGASLDLLPREFRLLEYMMRRKDQVLTRAMLFQDVWRYKFVPRSNLVDVHMGRLRRKVDPPGQPPMIVCVRSEGFMLREPA